MAVKLIFVLTQYSPPSASPINPVLIVENSPVLNGDNFNLAAYTAPSSTVVNFAFHSQYVFTFSASYGLQAVQSKAISKTSLNPLLGVKTGFSFVFIVPSHSYVFAYSSLTGLKTAISRKLVSQRIFNSMVGMKTSITKSIGRSITAKIGEFASAVRKLAKLQVVNPLLGFKLTLNKKLAKSISVAIGTIVTRAKKNAAKIKAFIGSIASISYSHSGGISHYTKLLLAQIGIYASRAKNMQRLIVALLGFRAGINKGISIIIPAKLGQISTAKQSSHIVDHYYQTFMPLVGFAAANEEIYIHRRAKGPGSYRGDKNHPVFGILRRGNKIKQLYWRSEETNPMVVIVSVKDDKNSVPITIVHLNQANIEAKVPIAMLAAKYISNDIILTYPKTEIVSSKLPITISHKESLLGCMNIYDDKEWSKMGDSATFYNKGHLEVEYNSGLNIKKSDTLEVVKK
jgi:hypothetical protein